LLIKYVIEITPRFKIAYDFFAYILIFISWYKWRFNQSALLLCGSVYICHVGGIISTRFLLYLVICLTFMDVKCFTQSDVRDLLSVQHWNKSSRIDHSQGY